MCTRKKSTTPTVSKNKEIKKLSTLKHRRLFLEPRLFRTHILQAIEVLGKALATYVVISGIGVLLFAVLYNLIGGADEYIGKCPLATAWYFIKKSCKVYWSYGEWSATRGAFFEMVFRDCVGVCMLGKIVTGMMIPNNPIEFCDFFIVTKDEKKKKDKIKLRYWVMLPIGAFLHDPKLRVLLINDDAFHAGEGKLDAKLQCDCEYSGIRGVRALTLDEDNSRQILAELGKKETKYKMVFMISGTLVDGRQYFSEKRYTIKDKLIADDYLSIRKKEYPEGLERKEKIPYKMYINFKMAYRVRDNKLRIYYKPSKYVRAKKEKITGIIELDDWYKQTFKGIQGRINLIFNRLILWQYDLERPMFKKLEDEKTDEEKRQEIEKEKAKEKEERKKGKKIVENSRK